MHNLCVNYLGTWGLGEYVAPVAFGMMAISMIDVIEEHKKCIPSLRSVG